MNLFFNFLTFIRTETIDNRYKKANKFYKKKLNQIEQKYSNDGILQQDSSFYEVEEFLNDYVN